MELRHLRYFVAVAELLHFGRAAASLGTSQPSLSQQIRQLEAELDAALFHRTKRRVQLTEAGRLFLEEARATLAHLGRAASVARRASRGEIGQLIVAYGPWTDSTRLMTTVKVFSERRPGVHIELRHMAVHPQIAALREERIDVGVLRPPVNDTALDSQVLVREPFVAALPEHHRFARKGSVTLSTLADEQFVLFPRDVTPYFYDTMLRLCREAGFVPHVRHDADHPHTVLGMVAAGIGIALVPESSRRVEHPGIAFRRLRPSRPVLQTAVAWRRDHRSPNVDAFLQVAREVMADGQVKGPARSRR